MILPVIFPTTPARRLAIASSPCSSRSSFVNFTMWGVFRPSSNLYICLARGLPRAVHTLDKEELLITSRSLNIFILILDCFLQVVHRLFVSVSLGKTFSLTPKIAQKSVTISSSAGRFSHARERTIKYSIHKWIWLLLYTTMLRPRSSNTSKFRKPHDGVTSTRLVQGFQLVTRPWSWSFHWSTSSLASFATVSVCRHSS